MLRIDRLSTEERKIKFTRDFTSSDYGSVFAECGKTRVLCTVSVSGKIPDWMKTSNTGWLTAEYGMIPNCSKNRISREKHLSSGRTKEIQRLIGRSLRTTVDFEQLGPMMLNVDCDVIEADGGTRTTSINGAVVALADTFLKMHKRGELEKSPFKGFIAAISVGKVEGIPVCDLEYSEDSNAGVDMNIVMNSNGQFIEIQGTSEKDVFDRDTLDIFLNMACDSIKRIIELEKSIFSKDEIDWLLK